MTAASSSTIPSSFGVPPRPTEWSLGSASTTATPAIAASSGSAPSLTICMAISTALRLPLEMTTGRFEPGFFIGAAPMDRVARLAALDGQEGPAVQARRHRVSRS